MSLGKCYNWTVRPDTKYEYTVNELPSEKVVESGCPSTKSMVRRFRDAGVRLTEYKREMFDVEHGAKVDIETVEVDPTRNGAYDLSDVTELSEQIARNVSVREAIKKAEKKAKENVGKVEEVAKDGAPE